MALLQISKDTGDWEYAIISCITCDGLSPINVFKKSRRSDFFLPRFGGDISNTFPPAREYLALMSRRMKRSLQHIDNFFCKTN